MLLLGLLILVVPIAELYVIIQVAHVIGGWQTIAVLIIESFVAAWLLKRQGRGALIKISRAVEEGRVPGKELIDGFLVVMATVLMMTPGFLTDIVGFFLLIPPTRALVRAGLVRRFRSGRHGRLFTMAASGPGGGRFVGTFRADGVQDVSGSEPGQDRPPPRGLTP
ncbi:MAG: FxsA cytoplasmic rane protein [Acidimicrobiales bacterium]|nr:FxsA cytoplasmic rane protein [Acidimicrobiales bacterium]